MSVGPFRAIPIREFLQRRINAYEEAKLDPQVIAIEPPDNGEVICDVCNAEIHVPFVDGVIWVNDFGAYCSICRRKYGPRSAE